MEQTSTEVVDTVTLTGATVGVIVVLPYIHIYIYLYGRRRMYGNIYMQYGIEVPPFESHHICFCVNKNANAFFSRKNGYWW